MSTYGAIAALLQGGLQGADGRRAMLEHDAALKQQEADRLRAQRIQDEQMAGQRADLLKGHIAGLVAGGNNQTAAALIPQWAQDFNTAAHTNVVGPSIKGATVDAVMNRPSPNFQGPMPMGKRQDFNTPATSSAILAAIGAQPAKPNLMEVSPGASLYDPVAKAFTGTAPIADNPYKMTAEQQMAAAKAKLDNAVATTQMRAASAMERAANRPAQRRHTTTAVIEVNGKPTTVLIDSETGDVIKEVGVKPTAPRADQKPKPWDQQHENQAMQGAKLKYPDNAMGGASADTIKKREAYVAESKRQHIAAQRQASGEKSMTQKLVEMMDAERKARAK
jgi:hypothetical protein